MANITMFSIEKVDAKYIININGQRTNYTILDEQSIDSLKARYGLTFEEIIDSTVSSTSGGLVKSIAKDCQLVIKNDGWTVDANLEKYMESYIADWLNQIKTKH